MGWLGAWFARETTSCSSLGWQGPQRDQARMIEQCKEKSHCLVDSMQIAHRQTNHAGIMDAITALSLQGAKLHGINVALIKSGKLSEADRNWLLGHSKSLEEIERQWRKVRVPPPGVGPAAPDFQTNGGLRPNSITSADALTHKTRAHSTMSGEL